MAIAQEVVRRLSIQATTSGVDQAKAKLDDLAASQGGVAVTSERTERATLSAQRQFEALERRMLPAIRAQRDYERALRVVETALGANPALQERASAALAAAAERYHRLTLAANDNATAVDRQAVAMERAAAVHARVNAITGVTGGSDNTARAADIAAYGQALDRLQAKYDPLFAAGLKYKRALDEINEAERVGAIAATTAIQARLAETNSYNAQVATLERIAQVKKAAAQVSVNQQLIVPDRGADIAAYGQQLDALRAKYNPLYAAGRQYKDVLTEINMAAKVGAISEAERAAALARTKTAFAQQVVDLKAASAANSDLAESGKASTFQTANLAAQFQDIAVQLQGGQSPFSIALQQGTQITQVLGQRGATGVVGLLSAAFASLVSPISLITIGTIALGGAMFQWGAKALGASSDFEEAIKKNADLIESLKRSAGEAGRHIETSARENAAVIRAELAKSTSEITKMYESQSKSIAFSLQMSIDGYKRLTDEAGKSEADFTKSFGSISAAVSDFARSVTNGKPDIQSLRTSLAQVVSSDADRRIKDVAASMLEQTKAAGDLKARLDATADSMRNLTNEAMDAAAQGEAFAKALRDLDSSVSPKLSEREKIMERYNVAVEKAQGTEERLLAARHRDNQFSILSENERKKSFEDSAKAAESSAKRFSGMFDSMSRNNAAIQGQIASVGKGVAEMARLETQFKLTEAAMQAFGRVTPQMAAKIDLVADAAGKAREKLESAKIVDQIEFDRATVGLSSVDKQIAQIQRRLHGNDWQNWMDDGIAQAMRLNFQLERQRAEYEDIVRVVGGTLSSTLADAFSGGIKSSDDFFNHVSRGFARLAERQFQKLFDFSDTGMWSMAAANDNNRTTDIATVLGKEVQAGAKKGTQEGSFGGTLTGMFTALGMSGQDAKTAGGVVAAGLGGFGMGYQSQDPMMGAAGGALSGAMAGAVTGNPVMIAAGAIIGGIAGAVGGMLGNSKVKKEAQAELAKNRGAIESLLATGEGTGIGSVTKTFRDYFDEMAKAVEVAAKAGDRDLQKRLSASAGTFFDRLRTDWDRNFEGLTESLRAGLGDSSPFMQAAKNVTELRESLKGLVSDTWFINQNYTDKPQAEWQRSVDEMVLATRAMALSVLTGAREFSTMEQAVQRIDGAASALQITLEQLHMTAEEAAAAIDAGIVVALNNLRKSLSNDIARSLNELSDFGFLNEIMDAQSAFFTRMRDLSALGMDNMPAIDELNLRLRQIATEASLTDDQLRQVAAAFPMLSGSLLSLIGTGGVDTAAAVTNAKAALDAAKANLRSAYEEEKRLLEQVVSRHDALIKSLQKFRDDLRLDSNLSPLDPWQRLQEAQKQYQETAALALTGDEDALGRLEDVSRSYLEEAKAYYASSEAYFSIFTEVEGLLDQAVAMAGHQLSEAEQQLAALQALVSPLIDIDTSVLSVADAIAALQQAEAEHAAAQAARDAARDAALLAALARVGESLSVDRGLAYLQNNPDVAQAVAAGQFGLPGQSPSEAAFLHWQMYGQHEMGQPGRVGYASGGFTGMIPTNAVAGVVHGQEFVMNAEATRRWRPQFEALNAGSNPFMGDNSALVSLVAALREEVRGLRDELNRNTQVTAMGAQEQVAAVRGTTRAVDKQGEVARRVAHRRAA